MQADPIFALIAGHRTAYAQFRATSKASINYSGEEPAHLIQKYHHDYSAQIRALRKICRTKPTTIEGLYAALAYCQEVLTGDMLCEDVAHPLVRAAFKTMAEAAADMVSRQPIRRAA